MVYNTTTTTIPDSKVRNQHCHYKDWFSLKLEAFMFCSHFEGRYGLVPFWAFQVHTYNFMQ